MSKKLLTPPLSDTTANSANSAITENTVTGVTTENTPALERDSPLEYAPLSSDIDIPRFRPNRIKKMKEVRNFYNSAFLGYMKSLGLVKLVYKGLYTELLYVYNFSILNKPYPVSAIYYLLSTIYYVAKRSTFSTAKKKY